MNEWESLHGHSHFSLLDCISRPHQIAGRCVELGLSAWALTDHGSISGAVAFMKACKSVCRCSHQKGLHPVGKCNVKGCSCQKFDGYPLKPILGCEFYVCSQDATLKTVENARLSHLVILAKDLDGWKNLIQAVSSSNSPEHIYRRPRLDLDRLGAFSGGKWFVISGHPGSTLADVVWTDRQGAYSARTYEEAKGFVREDWEEVVPAALEKHLSLFGRDNVRLEVQLIDQANMPAATVLANLWRWLSKKTGIPCVATADPHYPRREDAADQRIHLCSALETTLPEVQRKTSSGEDIGLGCFFRSNNYHMPSREEMAALHTPEELAEAGRVAAACESYDILGKPRLPTFACPDGKSENDYLTELCREGWKKKILPMLKRLPASEKKAKEKEYTDRVKMELGVITGFGLSGYFLIVWDLVDWAIKKTWKVGKGRGSAAGCLVSYLLNITNVDPVKHDLIFERFMNAGRFSPGRISLPDIDLDFPSSKREKIVEHAREKYGSANVCQLATFSRSQGRGALKDVFRAHERMSFEEMNRVTESIPDESEIADQLQDMREATGEASIIRWALEHRGSSLKEWCYLDKEGELQGPLAKDFAQAIRLEGTYRSMGKHAAGVIISSVPLAEHCPMAYDKTNKVLYAGMDMKDMEEMGFVKFDVLGVAVLDRIQMTEHLIRTGVLPDD